MTHRPVAESQGLGVDLSTADPYDSAMRLQRRGTLVAPPPPGPGPAPGAPAPGHRGGRRYDPAWNDWTPPRRWPGILLSCVIVLGFLSAVAYHLRPHTTPHKAKVVFPRGNLDVKPPFMPSVKGARAAAYAGTHDTYGLRFASNGGLLVMHARCKCQYNFIVEIQNQSLTPVAYPVDGIGHMDLVLSATVPPGPLLITVRAAGPWFLQLVQPAATTPTVPVPFKYLSTGNDVIGPFSSSDAYMSFQYLSTDGAAVVHVLDTHGFGLVTPFSGRIAIKAHKTLTGLPNPYFLEVDTTGGLWDLIVRR